MAGLRDAVQAVCLRQVPQGMPRPQDFELRSLALPPLADGQLRVRVDWLSLDPFLRAQLGGRYAVPCPPVGSVVPGYGIGTVLEDRSGRFAAGDLVSGMTGWARQAVLDAAAVSPVQVAPAPVRRFAALTVDPLVIARLRGEGSGWVMRREILPNIATPLLVLLAWRSLRVPKKAMLQAAALGVLGIGIGLASADTGNDDRDSTLKTADFFNIGKFAQARYRAEGFRKLDDGRYAADGTLTQDLLGASLGLIDVFPPAKRVLAEQMMFGTR